MPVVGIDLGTENCVIAQVTRGGVDIIANEVSRRASAYCTIFVQLIIL